ncbi:YafY family protein [Paenibacillus sp. YYML68]|uniref:helix-turn-helix transcriptional regulator n=1 Tax=Paenibacillus sp. YYML68 TaxID=2909250 RepID=UPI0024902C74|nr:YafY family protein [Paenibacillus sp. YYML68]
MHKAQRLIQLIMLVNERQRFTIQELADECGVSRRTMIRDLMELGELGVPLYSEVGAGGGYRVLREKVLPPISFTENEALALFFACQSLRNYRWLPFRNEVDMALTKFMQYVSSEMRQRISRMKQRLVFWVPPHQLEVPYLEQLLEAALAQQLIRIDYASSSSRKERTVQPIGLYTMNGLWYFHAYCWTARDYRVFRADRVGALTVESDQSASMDLSDTRIDSWILPEETAADAAGESQAEELVVELTSAGVKRCETDLWLARAMHVHKDGRGTIRASMPASYRPWVVRYMLSLGTDAHVLAPASVREQLRSELHQLLRQYE